MSILVEQLQEEPIIIYRYPALPPTDDDIRQALQQGQTFYQNIDGPLCIIHDATNLQIDFTDILFILATLTKETPIDTTARSVRIYAAGDSDLVRLAAQASAQDQYGAFNTKAYATFEEAVAAARSDLAA